jgi:hypothetical protein
VKKAAGTKKAARKPAPAKAAKKVARKAAAKKAVKRGLKKGVAKKAAAKAPVRKAAPKKTALKKAAVRKAPARKTAAAKRPAPPKAAGKAKATAPARTRAARPKRASRPAPIRGAIPSSLSVTPGSSAAQSGHNGLVGKLQENTEIGPALTGGDVDANWEVAYSSGDEAPGGDNPTPDQDIVDDIGHALGIEYEDNEELKGAAKLEERDRHRWELDPASAEDYPDHDE